MDALHNLIQISNREKCIVFNKEKLEIIDMMKLSIRRRFFNIYGRSLQCQHFVLFRDNAVALFLPRGKSKDGEHCILGFRVTSCIICLINFKRQWLFSVSWMFHNNKCN